MTGRAAIINPQNYRRLLAECLAEAGGGDLHVFGYGSLMWRPGFRARSSSPARLFGYSRRLSVWSSHYRGDKKRPGLVFGLDSGGSCNGVLLCAAAADKARVAASLFRREMFAGVYRPQFVFARRLGDGKKVRALTFVVRRDGAHYAAPMPMQNAAKIIRRARGIGGDNADYIINSRRQLQNRGIPCPQLAALCRLLQD